MIISRSPLRVSLGGGGTDIISYYSKYGGYVIAGAINKYVYVTVNRPFDEGIYLKYSEIERASSVDNIKHPIMREVLKSLDLANHQVEITTLADIPAGTGLGSSGSFTTSLIKSLYSFYRKTIHTKELAELACAIEIDKLGEPIGKQDQYISAYGGITEFEFLQTGEVIVKPLQISTQTLHDLEDNLLLFFTGISRSASKILKNQVERSISQETAILENLNHIKNLGFKSREALVSGDVKYFGALMDEHWRFKQERSTEISNNFINETYDIAIKSGALGGKLVGAGGGGFLMLYASDSERLRKTMNIRGLQEVRFTFDYEGTKVILS